MDIDHLVGGDIAVASNGDLALVDGSLMNQQRILRRLLTNPQTTNADGTINAADYAEHPTYGGGLGRFIGGNATIAQTASHIRGQMLLESCVARTPEPQIDIQAIDNGIACQIQYKDATTGTNQVLSFNVNV